MSRLSRQPKICFQDEDQVGWVDSGSIPVKKPSILRFGAPTFRSQLLMPCGKHSKPRNVPAEPRQIGDRPRKPAQRYRRALRDDGIRGSCLCDYHDYPELRAEKKQYSIPTCLNRIIHHFTPDDFPAEIRNKIYWYALVSDEPIELCPEPFDYNGSGRVRGGRSGEEAYDEVHKHYRQKTKALRSDAAALMRTNKKYSDEAAFIFFSENEFRFSNTSGWVTLYFFLFMIRLKKASMLRRITVCHPSFTVLPRSISSEVTFSSGSVYFHLGRPRTFGDTGVLSGPGFDYYIGRWWEEDKLTNDPSLILQKAKTLHHLRFVIPAFLTQDDVPGTLESPVDASKFNNLDIIFAGLHTKQLVLSYNMNNQPVHHTASKAKDAAEAHAIKTGKKTKYEVHWVNDLGIYTQSTFYEVQLLGKGDGETSLADEA